MYGFRWEILKFDDFTYDCSWEVLKFTISTCRFMVCLEHLTRKVSIVWCGEAQPKSQLGIHLSLGHSTVSTREAMTWQTIEERSRTHGNAHNIVGKSRMSEMGAAAMAPKLYREAEIEKARKKNNAVTN